MGCSIQLIPDSQSLSWFIILLGLVWPKYPSTRSRSLREYEPFVYAHSLFNPPLIFRIPSTTSVRASRRLGGWNRTGPARTCKHHTFLIFQSFSVPFPSNSLYIAFDYISIGSICRKWLIRLQLTEQDRYAVYSYFQPRSCFSLSFS